jgi:hypothetical protein
MSRAGRRPGAGLRPFGLPSVAAGLHRSVRFTEAVKGFAGIAETWLLTPGGYRFTPGGNAFRGARVRRTLACVGLCVSAATTDTIRLPLWCIEHSANNSALDGVTAPLRYRRLNVFRTPDLAPTPRQPVVCRLIRRSGVVRSPADLVRRDQPRDCQGEAPGPVCAYGSAAVFSAADLALIPCPPKRSRGEESQFRSRGGNARNGIPALGGLRPSVRRRGHGPLQNYEYGP